jgi:hypothetical protein
MNTMDGTNRRSRGVPEILCNTNIYGIGKVCIGGQESSPSDRPGSGESHYNTLLTKASSWKCNGLWSQTLL